MRVLLVAGESAGVEAFKAIRRSGHSLVAVMAGGAGRGATEAGPLLSLAEASGVPAWPPAQVREPAFAARIHEAKVHLVLNVHSLFVFHPDVLKAPAIGSFNLHPGPLPRCAGLNAPSWALYLGETRHGVTLHWMSPAIDAGPVAFQ